MLTLLGWIGALAAATLALATLIGPVLHGSDGVYINLVMGVVFALWAVFLAWRARVLSRLRARDDDDSDLRQLLRIETVAAAATALVAALLASMAVYRVFSEGFAVFG